MLVDTIASIKIGDIPAWIAVLGVIIVSLEAKRLPLLWRSRQSDGSPHARGRALGQKLGVSVRFLTFVLLVGMLCLRIPWAGIPLAVLLVYTGLCPAWTYARGFATGFTESSGRKPSYALVALFVVGYFAFGRGLLAFFAVIASFVLRGGAT
jgi:hypothetical protein